MKFLIFAVLYQIFYICNAQYISDKPCPNRPVMQNFNISKIAGRWYNLMQYEDAYASSYLCGNGNYSVIDDKSLKVHECELRMGTYSCLTGIIALVDPNRKPLEGSTSYASIDDPNKIIDHFKYLQVDYDDHAIVYNCKNISSGKSEHFLWIASRTPKVSPKGKIAIDTMIDQYFDRRAIKHIVQDERVCKRE